MGPDLPPDLRRADRHRGAWWSPAAGGCCGGAPMSWATCSAPVPSCGRPEADMVAVLGELGLSRLGDIPGLSAVGAAAILAETGDPCRYDSSSSLVKHAGCHRPRTPPAPSPARRISPAAAAGPAAGRLARGVADAPVQPRDGRQVRRDDPGRRRCRGRRGGGCCGIAASQSRNCRGPRAARQGPRRVRSVLAALDLHP